MRWVGVLVLYLLSVSLAYLPVPEFGKEQYVDLPVKVSLQYYIISINPIFRRAVRYQRLHPTLPLEDPFWQFDQ